MSEPTDDPGITGVHHIALTVTDVEASAGWYERVFGAIRLPTTFPHHEREETGHAVLMLVPGCGLPIGLHHHVSHAGEPFDEVRTGLDHVGFGVDARGDLDRWATKLDGLGVEHSGVRDVTEPVPFSTLVFRDPDGIQLELYANS
jgi:catechol 2,3-dioxygenase-like lactoylglutathione lyase family enzyme